MRIHALTFAAIGPFAGQHTIEFDLLGGSSLFLIDGPTGAGKSTIIDAIVFALYGDVAGRASDRQRLRSAFAAPEQESFAELDFSTSAGRFRVRRTPDYTRPKKRGEGTTPVASSVVASRSTGNASWEPISGSKGEADAEIQRWVGLTRAQFLQTVVLPQGEFANFLAAESKDRLTVLERIFATELYSRMEVELDERRKEAEAERQSAAAAVRAAIRDVYSRLPDEEPPLAVVPAEDPDAPSDASLAVLADLVAQCDLILAERTEATAVLTARRVELDERLEARLLGDEARRRLDDCRADVSRTVLADAAAQDAMASHGTVLAGVGGDPADAAGAMRIVERVLGQLQETAEAEARMTEATRAVDAQAAGVARIDDEIVLLDAERDVELPERLRRLAQDLGACLAQARAESAGAADREAEMVRARHGGMAAELADGLVEGESCPVCGALDHPHPAEPAGNRITEADVAAAARRRSAADEHHHAIDLQRERIAPLVSVPGVNGDAAERPTAVPSLADIEVEIGHLQDRSAALAGRRAELEVRRAGDAAALDAARAARAERLARIAEARASFETVAERVTALTAAAEGLALLETTDRDVARARLALLAAERELVELVAERPEAEWSRTPDLLELRRALAAEEQAAEAARAGLAAMLVDVRARIQRVADACANRDEVQARTGEVIALAGIVRGGDGNRLAQPLSAYVVQTMFDEVLHVANQRLRVMLDGRFELQGTEGRTGRKLTGLGLGLEVRDLRTDTVRKTATLSGGESFCASLALALGLADTVRANAGGIEIGMLFIDEGFGSLDVDRLDDVMSELTRLQADGRTVGVISHVTEMKRTIQERIDVRVLGTHLGSTIDVSWDTSGPPAERLPD